MTAEVPAGAEPRTQLVHGTSIRLGGHGLLITGAPGSGKSDLALRLIDQPGCSTGREPMSARLVADDQVLIVRRGDRLLASPPPSLAGLLEIRGLGIVPLDHEPEAELHLAVRLAAAREIERLPELFGSAFTLLGIALPEVVLDPREASAPAKLRCAVVELLRRGAEIAR
jgi:HPr kinase/phosphorylase